MSINDITPDKGNTPAPCKHILIPGRAHCEMCGDQILFTGLERTRCQSKKAPSAAAAESATAHDPNKDYISTLLLELGQANAIVDLLFMVASEEGTDSMCDGTLESSLHTVMMRLSAVKAAAEALLDEKAALRSAAG
jgi:hypothetical protein